MGPLFSLVLGIVLSGIVGTVIGVIVAFGVMPTYYVVKGVPKEKRRFRLKHALVTIIACTGVLAAVGGIAGVVGIVADMYEAGDYYADDGVFDTWRVPIGYPYDITTGSQLESGGIRLWYEDHKPAKTILLWVTHLQPTGDYVVGRRSPEEYDFSRDLADQISGQIDSGGYHTYYPEEYFVFCLHDGTILKATADRDFNTLLDSLGIDSTLQLQSLKEYYYAYWNEHR